MKNGFSDQVKAVVEEVLAGEIQISYGNPAPYNNFVAEGDSVTAVSASGRVMTGSEAVKQASVTVSEGNIGETNRFMEFISGDMTDNMMYAVFKTGVTISKTAGSLSDLCWVVTFVFRRQASGLAFFSRPLEGTGFQTLVQQYKSIAFPVQRLDSVPPSAAKQK